MSCRLQILVSAHNMSTAVQSDFNMKINLMARLFRDMQKAPFRSHLCGRIDVCARASVTSQEGGERNPVELHSSGTFFQLEIGLVQESQDSNLPQT